MSEGKKFHIHKHFKIESAQDPLVFRKPINWQSNLEQVEPIEQGSWSVTREDLSKVAEVPLLRACEILFDKGVETYMSSANKKDIEVGEVHLIVKYDSLSDTNKRIARPLGEMYTYLDKRYVKLVMPVDASTTVQQISDYMCSLAEKFENQTQ